MAAGGAAVAEWQDVGVVVRPISVSALLGEITADLLGRSGRVRVAVDGAEALGPHDIAAALAGTLRDHGRYAIHVNTDDYLLPASQRYEFGRTSPESFYQGWRDERGIQREVLEPAAPDGSGRVLPALWRADVDRSARAEYVTIPDDGIALVSGQFLLGGVLAFELAVHLEGSASALARRTATDRAWTLPAYAQYADEVAPATFADVVVRMEDPRHPALVRSTLSPRSQTP